MKTWRHILCLLVVTYFIKTSQSVDSTVKRFAVASSAQESHLQHFYLEDQIAAIFNKVALNADNSTSLRTPVSYNLSVPLSSISVTTEKFFINSPKIPQKIALKTLEFKTSPRLPIHLTPFPDLNWFVRNFDDDSKTSVPVFPPKMSESKNATDLDRFKTDIVGIPNKYNVSLFSTNATPSNSTAIVASRKLESVHEPNAISRLVTSPSTYAGMSFPHNYEAVFSHSSGRNRNPGAKQKLSLLTSKRKDSLLHQNFKVTTLPSSSFYITNSHLPNYSWWDTIKHNHQIPRYEEAFREWGLAWEFHIYSIGALFVLLALYAALNILFFRSKCKIVTSKFYVFINSIMFILGSSRTALFFKDAYNFNNSYPPAVVTFILNLGLPCLLISFSIIIHFLFDITKLHLFDKCVPCSTFLIISILVYIMFSFAGNILYILIPRTVVLANMCNLILVLWLAILSSIYCFAYGKLRRTISKLKRDLILQKFVGNDFRMNFITPSYTTLIMAVNVTLANSVLTIIISLIYLYGIFESVSSSSASSSPQPWPWWIYQFSLRVLEVLLSYLFLFVSSLEFRSDSFTSKKNQSKIKNRLLRIFMNDKKWHCKPDILDDSSGCISQTNHSESSYTESFEKQDPKKEYDHYPGCKSLFRKLFLKFIFEISVRGTSHQNQCKNSLLNFSPEALPYSKSTNNNQGSYDFSNYDSKMDCSCQFGKIKHDSDQQSGLTSSALRLDISHCLELFPPHIYEEIYYYTRNHNNNHCETPSVCVPSETYERILPQFPGCISNNNKFNSRNNKGNLNAVEKSVSNSLIHNSPVVCCPNIINTPNYIPQEVLNFNMQFSLNNYKNKQAENACSFMPSNMNVMQKCCDNYRMCTCSPRTEYPGYYA